METRELRALLERVATGEASASEAAAEDAKNSMLSRV